MQCVEEIKESVKSPEQEIFEEQGKLDLMRKLHMIEGATREVMYLRLLGNLSFKEIGDILSKSENWARVTYYRGKERLKKELDCHGQ